MKKILFALPLFVPNAVEAQTTPQQFFACYVPSSGVVYRIKEPGLKDECTGKKHVEFGWAQLFADSDGKVGIGTSTPTAALDVVGDIHASGQLKLGNTMIFDGVANTITTGLNEDMAILPGGTGKVGIGTSSPSEALTVNGIVQSTSGGFRFPDGTVQTTASGGGGGGGTSDHGSLSGLGDDDHLQYLRANGVRAAANGFAVTGNLGQGTIPIEGAGIRLMWYPREAAFRVGAASPGTPWNAANIGRFSVAMGQNTKASGMTSFAMGAASEAEGNSAVAMGAAARAIGPVSVALGNQTVASGSVSTAIGAGTEASGFASAAFGWDTEASGDNTTAMGTFVSTDGHEGSFIFGDRHLLLGIQKVTADNSFVVRAQRVWFGKIGDQIATIDRYIETSTGAFLSDGGVWTNGSDRNRKENFQDESGEDVLAKIADMPIQSWNYKAENPSVRHLGPTAQDFYAAFGLGDSDKTIPTVDIDGVNLLAIQALEERTRELYSRIAELDRLSAELAEVKEENREVAAMLAQLTAAVERLEASAGSREQ